MAKACAYLCRQCCFIDGFGEFGLSLCLHMPVKSSTLLASVKSVKRSN